MIRLFFVFILIVLLSSFLTLAALTFFVWTKNPYNIRTCLVENYMKSTPTAVKENAAEKASSTEVTKTDKPIFSFEQENLLTKAGIEPASVSPEMLIEKEACFVEKLGADRVKEIKAGDIPNALEIFKVKGCF